MRLVSIILFALLLGGCALPRVIVLNDPLDAAGHNDLGVAYEQRGEFDLAVREYDRAAELERLCVEELRLHLPWMRTRGIRVRQREQWPPWGGELHVHRRECEVPQVLNQPEDLLGHRH